MDFSNFLQTSSTIEKGQGFSPWSPLHLAWLVFALCLFYVGGRRFRQLSQIKQRRYLRILAMLLLLDEAFKHICALLGGNWEPAFLPLHLCSINIFLCALYAWKPNKLTGELLYCECLPGAIAALLFPTWTKLPFLNFMHLHSFTVHILLALFPVLLLCGGMRPNFRRLPKCAGVLLLYCIPIFFLNKILDTNFVFLNGAGKGNPLSLLESLLGNPGYLLGIPILLAVLWTLLYIPWLQSRSSGHLTPNL